jgi:hypothetical protein
LGFKNYLPGLASNHDPSDLCLLSSWDYRREPLVPSGCRFFVDVHFWLYIGLGARLPMEEEKQWFVLQIIDLRSEDNRKQLFINI